MKWKLLMPHYINDALLPAGTVVGDDCQYNFNKPDGSMHAPSLNMEPADREAEAYLEKHPPKYASGQIPVEILQPPNEPVAGQRVGGQGPKPATSNAERIAGQGPESGNAASLDRALIDKALNAPATDPFPKKSNPFE